jgi:hypothetical protein
VVALTFWRIVPTDREDVGAGASDKPGRRSGDYSKAHSRSPLRYSGTAQLVEGSG